MRKIIFYLNDQRSFFNPFVKYFVIKIPPNVNNLLAQNLQTAIFKHLKSFLVCALLLFTQKKVLKKKS